MGELEDLDEQIEVETAVWNELGLNPRALRHDPESLWAMKLQIQAMMNVLLQKELVTEDELNIQYKRLTVNDMRNIAEDARKARREALRAHLVDGSGRKFNP